MGNIFDTFTDRLWPDPLAGPLMIRLYWVRGRRDYEVVGMRILRIKADDVRLHNMDISLLMLPDLIEDHRGQLPEEPLDGGGWFLPAQTNTRLEQVAAQYRAAVAAGSRSPIKDAARLLGWGYPATASLVSRARHVGLLPPTGRTRKREGKS